jgi:hypothetical protein
MESPIIHKGTREPLYHQGKVLDILVVKANQEASKIETNMSDLLTQTEESVAALRAAVRGIGQEIEEFKPLKKAMIEELRSLRITSAQEISTAMKPLEDIRQFFIGKDHDKEVGRLREFVELCERLERLKREGFLDAVADTIIKLA